MLLLNCIFNTSSKPMIKLSLFLLFPLLIFQSCDRTGNEFQKNLEEKVKTTFNEIYESSTPSIEEVKKLAQLEYHMEVFPLETSSREVDEKLNELGKERWNCFSSFARPRKDPQNPEMVVLCKRMPETMLRYIPKSFIGR